MGEVHDLGMERAARDTWNPLAWGPGNPAVVPGESTRNHYIIRKATELRLMRTDTVANTSLSDWIRLLETELEAAKLSSSL